MKPIMIDDLGKIENYKQARENSGVDGWHGIEPAPIDAVVWKKQSCTVGGNKCITVPRVGKGRPGYISKRGFVEHT